MRSDLQNIFSEIAIYSHPEKVSRLKKFFKAIPGGYGEGDKFCGISVPDTKKVAKKFRDINLEEIEILLNHSIHEIRLLAIFILVNQFNRKKYRDRIEDIMKLYLTSISNLNNWDLVDSSAYKLLGAYLIDKKKDILYEFARSGDLWKQRISIVATLWFIRNQQFEDTLNIAEILLNHPHDLIHKAVGWMIREVGNRDKTVEDEFLHRFYAQMPRTMLRYAIEKYPEDERQSYLKGII